MFLTLLKFRIYYFNFEIFLDHAQLIIITSIIEFDYIIGIYKIIIVLNFIYYLKMYF